MMLIINDKIIRNNKNEAHYINYTKYIPIVFQLQNTNYFCQGHKIQNTLNLFKIHVFSISCISNTPTLSHDMCALAHVHSMLHW